MKKKLQLFHKSVRAFNMHLDSKLVHYFLFQLSMKSNPWNRHRVSRAHQFSVFLVYSFVRHWPWFVHFRSFTFYFLFCVIFCFFLCRCHFTFLFFVFVFFLFSLRIHDNLQSKWSMHEQINKFSKALDAKWNSFLLFFLSYFFGWIAAACNKVFFIFLYFYFLFISTTHIQISLFYYEIKRLNFFSFCKFLFVFKIPSQWFFVVLLSSNFQLVFFSQTLLVLTLR